RPPCLASRSLVGTPACEAWNRHPRGLQDSDRRSTRQFRPCYDDNVISVAEATVEATLPDRWALAGGRASTKGCVICRGPRLPGARLCAPCKAALKRARLETVSELVPRPSRAAAE